MKTEIINYDIDGKDFLGYAAFPDGDNFPYHHTPRDIIEVAEKQNEKQFLITHSFASGKEEGRGFDMPVLPKNTIQLEDGELYNLELSGITILQSPLK